jgi:hypothetical protein
MSALITDTMTVAQLLDYSGQLARRLAALQDEHDGLPDTDTRHGDVGAALVDLARQQAVVAAELTRRIVRAAEVW